MDSPLDNAHFLSFEEWKRQNLAKAGQSAENLETRAGGGTDQRPRPGAINNALDSLGEDSEIEIDFGGFVSSGPSTPIYPKVNKGEAPKDGLNGAKSVEDLSSARRRSKDAGKTCKERSNYASFDCASTVLKTNSESKAATAVLVENKDSYMLNICSAKNKFFIVELCDDILIDTVVLANFEFFSSMFRTFRVSVSDRYPVKLEKWRTLGTYEAKNSREIQAFLIENPLIWARYVRVEFLTHFGNEYYCPVSLLRVHGTTMLEEFNHDVKGSRGDEDAESESMEAEEEQGSITISDVVTAEASEQLQRTSEPTQESPTLFSKSETATFNDKPSSVPSKPPATVQTSSKPSPLSGFFSYEFSPKKSADILFTSRIDTCKLEDQQADTTPAPPVSPRTYQSATVSEEPNVLSSSTVNRTSPVQIPTTRTDATKLADSSTRGSPPVNIKEGYQTFHESSKPSNQSPSASTARVPTSSTQPLNAIPTTQESFFKSVHKRLQLLESNSTLSLQYIEEQSRILRDAFSKVEKRQLGKTTTFLENLNTTVLTELRDFRNQYDQIWQSTVIELSSQRELSQHEVLALSARLSLLADEIIFQKRMAIVQFVLILLCLGLVIFAHHGSSATYLELPPLGPKIINKSSASVPRYSPHLETPPPSSSSTRPSSRYGIFRGFTHLRSPSEESQLGDSGNSPSIEYSPPTPPSQPSLGENRDDAASRDGDESCDSVPGLDAGVLRQTKSSPATPSGNREGRRAYVEGNLLKKTLHVNDYNEIG